MSDYSESEFLDTNDELSENEMKKLINLTNRLQDLTSVLGPGQRLKVSVPQIVVIGAQSEGKSSVLENIVGKDFLPRGAGIVTKRPLRLHLINYPGKEYGVFDHDSKIYESFNEIREEIKIETDRELQRVNDTVSSKEIVLRIYSPNVPDLTLIDLPGVISVAMDGQSKDIEKKIESIVVPFIENEGSLILAIIAANIDIANSVSLKLATKYDPERKRTIGVLTKLDLMDDGTDARKILDNQVIDLQRGYIGLVNRAQKDINENKDIAAALRKERDFFEKHPAYKDIKDRLGTPYLRKFLCQALCRHIKNVLPNFADHFTKEIALMKKKAEERDIKFIGGGSTPDKCLIAMLQKVKDIYLTELGMTYRLNSNKIDDEKLNRGVIINEEMCANYTAALSSISSNDEKLRKKLEILIQNHRGAYHGLFTPDQIYCAAITKEIDLLRPCSFKCIDSVVCMVTELLNACCDCLIHFPFLRNATKQLLINFVNDCAKNIRDYFEHKLQVECAFINTEHEDLNWTKICETMANESDDENNENISHSVTELCCFIASYMKIVKKTLGDFMPKLLTHDLFVSVINYLESEILLDLKKYNQDDLLSLDPTEERLLRDIKERIAKFVEAENEIRLLSIERNF